MTPFSELLATVRREHDRAVDAFFKRHGNDLEDLADACARAFETGGKLLLFGNGGSAADAQHLAAEFVNRFDRERAALPAMALTTDGSILTSIGNDSSFDELFARQVEALGRPRDIALGISTSGRSSNVVRGLRAARRSGLLTAALLGSGGGAAALEADLPLVVPGDDTPRIQEVHILAGHVLCRRVEDLLEAGSVENIDIRSESRLSSAGR
jgi:D-sedoheptulose 7-phosphate isomerase